MGIMGGGAAMRVAGKIAGVVNGSFRGGSTAIPLPEKLTTAACKAKTTRPVTGIFPSSDTQIDVVSSSTVTKLCYESEDWESEVSSDVGEPLPRLVFGGAPTLEEAKDATFELLTALDQAYLSDKYSGGSYVSDEEHDKLAVSDSGHLESKACVTKPSASTKAVQAFRLLKENAAVQTVVASVASDPNVWNAVLQNEALLEFFQSQNTGMNDSQESTAGAEIPVDQKSEPFAKHSDDEKSEPFAKHSDEKSEPFAKHSDDEKSEPFAKHSDDEKSEPKNGFFKFLKDFIAKLVKMISSSDFFQNLFAELGAVDGSAKADFIDMSHMTMGAIMRLVMMVIWVVVFKRI